MRLFHALLYAELAPKKQNTFSLSNAFGSLKNEVKRKFCDKADAEFWQFFKRGVLYTGPPDNIHIVSKTYRYINITIRVEENG